MFSKAVTLQRRLAITLVVCVVYQMGACPCGCIEHNYWMQALGFADDHGTAAVDLKGDISIASNEHDCEGSHDLLFVDNSIVKKTPASAQAPNHFVGPSLAALLPQATKVRPHDRGPPIYRSRCAIIQVFLI